MPLHEELLDIGGVPAHPSNRVEAVVGDALDLGPKHGLAAATVTIERRPPKSSAAVSGTSVAFDVPGLYRLRLDVAGHSRRVEVVAFPPSALGQRTGLDPNGPTTTRAHLRGLARDPAVTEATIAATLEATPPTLAGIAGGGSPPAWRNYL